jgi:hypothetical protein
MLKEPLNKIVWILFVKGFVRGYFTVKLLQIGILRHKAYHFELSKPSEKDIWQNFIICLVKLPLKSNILQVIQMRNILFGFLDMSDLPLFSLSDLLLVLDNLIVSFAPLPVRLLDGGLEFELLVGALFSGLSLFNADEGPGGLELLCLLSDVRASLTQDHIGFLYRSSIT